MVIRHEQTSTRVYWPPRPAPVTARRHSDPPAWEPDAGAASSEAQSVRLPSRGGRSSGRRREAAPAGWAPGREGRLSDRESKPMSWGRAHGTARPTRRHRNHARCSSVIGSATGGRSTMAGRRRRRATCRATVRIETGATTGSPRIVSHADRAGSGRSTRATAGERRVPAYPFPACYEYPRRTFGVGRDRSSGSSPVDPGTVNGAWTGAATSKVAVPV